MPASVVSRIMGRGGCNITAIQDVTGAHIDVDKQKDKNGERMITIRGGTESTRHAVQLINALIQDPAKELEDLIPRNHIRTPGSNTKLSSTFTTSTGATSTTASGAKGLPSVMPPSGVTFQPSSPSASQQGGKLGKSLAPGVRPPFVSLPLAYAHPQLALLAAQTMHQIRHPRLPVAQFGGTFSPSPNTWGPFPVRPVSPGSNNGSPKHNGAGSAPRPCAAQPEYAAAASNTGPASASPSAAAPPPACLPNAATPSTARKQLFSEPKTSSVTSTVSSVGAARASSSPSPLLSAPPVSLTPPPPPPPIAPPTQQLPQPKPEPCPSSTPGKEKPPVEQPAKPTVGGASEGNVPAGSLAYPPPAPLSTAPPQQEVRQPAAPPLPFVTGAEPALAAVPVGAGMPSSRPTPTVAQTSSTVAHFAASAPQVSPRMQPPAPFYPLAPGGALPEQQSVFVAPGPSQEGLKQQQQPPPQQQQHGLAAPAMPPPSMQMPSALGVLNGSQMHIHGAKAQLPPSFGPAALFNHFSSIFDGGQVGNSQMWGACHLPTRSAPEQAYSGPPAYMGGMGQMESVLPPPDSSKAPGYRCPTQRIVPSPIGKEDP